MKSERNTGVKYMLLFTNNFRVMGDSQCNVRLVVINIWNVNDDSYRKCKNILLHIGGYICANINKYKVFNTESSKSSEYRRFTGK